MSFCQHHKRAGMYTARNGKLFVATNDGNGELRLNELKPLSERKK